MTNLCALVISVFLRPVSTRRRRWTHKELLADKLQFTYHHYIFRMNHYYLHYTTKANQGLTTFQGSLS